MSRETPGWIETVVRTRDLRLFQELLKQLIYLLDREINDRMSQVLREEKKEAWKGEKETWKGEKKIWKGKKETWKGEKEGKQMERGER